MDVRRLEGGADWLVQVEAALLVPPGGDAGLLSARIPSLGLSIEKQVRACGNKKLT